MSPEPKSDQSALELEGQRVRITNGDAEGRRGVVYAVDADEDPPIVYVALDAVSRPWMPPENWDGWASEVALDEERR